jgi:DNA-binding transcriptional LysR family regulator
MDWDKLRIFHAVADAGSLTHAGETLNLSQSAVSRQIRALEEMLDTTLFHRHARGLILTEQGELLFDATAAMSKRLETAAARIRDSEDEVFGELRVTTTTGFGTLWLAPRLPALYAQVSRPEDRPDAGGARAGPADARGRCGDPDEGTQPGRPDPQAADERAHAALRDAGVSGRPARPQKIEDLSDHRLICQSHAAAQVTAGIAAGAPSAERRHPLDLTVNNYFGVLQAVLNNLGIGVLPDYLTEDFPDRPRSARGRKRTRCRCSSPIPRNCAIPSGWQPSAISCWKRSLPIAAAAR